MNDHFVFLRRVAYHETDAMGVLHHSNHVKYFEEARVEWLRAKGLVNIHQPYGPYVFAVVNLEMRYSKPARFDDELEIWVEARIEGAKIQFQYAMWSKRLKTVIADGATTLVAINDELRAVRLPEAAQKVFASGSWSEIWPPRK
jgi:acyl-CoA thioester hydrolase